MTAAYIINLVTWLAHVSGTRDSFQMTSVKIKNAITVQRQISGGLTTTSLGLLLLPSTTFIVSWKHETLSKHLVMKETFSNEKYCL